MSFSAISKPTLSATNNHSASTIPLPSNNQSSLSHSYSSPIAQVSATRPKTYKLIGYSGNKPLITNSSNQPMNAVKSSIPISSTRPITYKFIGYSGNKPLITNSSNQPMNDVYKSSIPSSASQPKPYKFIGYSGNKPLIPLINQKMKQIPVIDLTHDDEPEPKIKRSKSEKVDHLAAVMFNTGKVSSL